MNTRAKSTLTLIFCKESDQSPTRIGQLETEALVQLIEGYTGPTPREMAFQFFVDSFDDAGFARREVNGNTYIIEKHTSRRL